MIVECDRCSTKYRVREDRLPSNGGNIKCPGCAHVFFVAPPSESGSQEPNVPSTTTPSQLVSTGVHQRVVAGSDTNDAATRQMDAATLAAGAGLRTASPSTSLGPPGVGRPAPKVAPATPAAAPAAAAPAAMPEDTSWKLKTSFGLVYDFPDTASLRSWLAARDDLAGYQLSGDSGSTFKELTAFPSIMSADMANKLHSDSAAPRSTSFGLPTIGTSPDKISGGSTAPPPRPSGPNRLVLDPDLPVGKTPAARPSSSKQRAKSTGKPASKRPAPPSRRSASSSAEAEPPGKSPWVVPTVIFMAGLFVLLGLQIGGVVDFKKMLGIKAPKPAPTVVDEGSGNLPPESANPRRKVETNDLPPPPRRAPAADDSVVPTREAQVYHLLDQAKQEMSKRDYDRAVLTLTSAKAVAPNDPEVFRLLDRAYTRQGDRDSARVARDRFKELKAAKESGKAPN